MINIEEFTTAAREPPAESSSWIGLNKAHKTKKDLEGAIAAFKRGRLSNPDEGWFLKGLGDTYLVKRDFDGVIMTFKETIGGASNNSWLWGKKSDKYK
jgi:tetratricopeptide (TPR) repeat protein